MRLLATSSFPPTLVLQHGKAHLCVPFELPWWWLLDSREKVCAVDLGINTTAVASIVHRDGTVTARAFFDCAADIDRRDRRLKLISQKAQKTIGKRGKLAKGFCKGLYRRARDINRQIAHHIVNALIDFALRHDAPIIVFERLKGWRPRGGRKRSTLRQRFHGWLHRRIALLTEEKFIERGGRVAFVVPRGTSKYAFDGTGEVSRGGENYSLAVFSGGKRYHADLNASYNIGARYWAKELKLGGGNGPKVRSGRRSRRAPRMPVTLSTLWHHARGAECEAATTAAKAA